MTRSTPLWVILHYLPDEMRTVAYEDAKEVNAAKPRLEKAALAEFKKAGLGYWCAKRTEKGRIRALTMYRRQLQREKSSSHPVHSPIPD